MKSKLEKLEKALKDMRESNRDAWSIYGSELCAGEMIREEEKLEREIEQLKSLSHKEDPKYIIDD